MHFIIQNCVFRFLLKKKYIYVYNIVCVDKKERNKLLIVPTLNLMFWPVAFFSYIQVKIKKLKIAKDCDITTVFIYSHQNTPINQWERTYYLNYSITKFLMHFTGMKSSSKPHLYHQLVHVFLHLLHSLHYQAVCLSQGAQGSHAYLLHQCSFQ